jgi:hypothetical protein
MIIAGIGVGAGALVFGVLMLALDYTGSEEATFVASGSALLVASLAALVVYLTGGFRELVDRDRDDREY